MVNGGGSGGSGRLRFREAPVSKWGLERLATMLNTGYEVHIEPVGPEPLTYSIKIGILVPYCEDSIPLDCGGEILEISTKPEERRISRMVWYANGDAEKDVVIGSDGEEGLDKLMVIAIIASREVVQKRYNAISEMILAVRRRDWETLRDRNTEFEKTFVPDNKFPRLPRTAQERDYELCAQACLRAFSNIMMYDRSLKDAEEFYAEIRDLNHPNTEE
ncbi:MAG: hypothetical protein KAT43_00950 [Nanoarchaeota archaeon]|nr:hypothetical protein [Nanoarchaeota archaeon]